MQEAVALARTNIEAGGRPFGAVLVLDGKVCARAVNETHVSSDPTAHAELLAIRYACQAMNRLRLDGSTIYASGQPCPMCLAAMHLCGVSRALYAYSSEDGAPFGLSNSGLYAQMSLTPGAQSLPLQPLRPTGEDGLYTGWQHHQR